ncbi:hypothetical protein ACJX0J_037994, partial [Zea mays]
FNLGALSHWKIQAHMGIILAVDITNTSLKFRVRLIKAHILRAFEKEPGTTQNFQKEPGTITLSIYWGLVWIALVHKYNISHMKKIIVISYICVRERKFQIHEGKSSEINRMQSILACIHRACMPGN